MIHNIIMFLGDLSRVQWLGVLLVVVGYVVRVWIRRRRFNRRSDAGMQGFPTFWHAFFLKPLEMLVKGAGGLIFIAGFVLLFVEWFNHLKL